MHATSAWKRRSAPLWRMRIALAERVTPARDRLIGAVGRLSWRSSATLRRVVLMRFSVLVRACAFRCRPGGGRPTGPATRFSPSEQDCDAPGGMGPALRLGMLRRASRPFPPRKDRENDARPPPAVPSRSPCRTSRRCAPSRRRDARRASSPTTRSSSALQDADVTKEQIEDFYSHLLEIGVEVLDADGEVDRPRRGDPAPSGRPSSTWRSSRASTACACTCARSAGCRC